MRKILLNKNRGKESINKTNYIPVELNRETSLFQEEVLSDTVDTLKVYNDEKNNSTKHRFIFTLYPICTNVLFNKITEIVYKEGSDEAKLLTNNEFVTKDGIKSVSSQKLNRIQAIRNTEYSNTIFNLEYHCGLDIFNNHLLRSTEDNSVQKKTTASLTSTCNVYDETQKETKDKFLSLDDDAFNTIGDVYRNYSGNVLATYIPNKKYNYTYRECERVKTPLYLYDEIKTFNKSCNDNIKRKDGWVGFTNPSTIKIPIINDVDKENAYYVNKCINNKDSCEFINLSPEKDLFSFTPKKNKYRNRLEYNWDYCLTYPYKSIYTDSTKTILKGKEFGLPLAEFDDGNIYMTYFANNNIEMALFRCPVKHNLNIGDSIYLNMVDENEAKIGNFILTNKLICTVASLGKLDKKEKDRYFSIRLSDFEDYTEKIVGFTKLVKGGFQCEYYFRLFKKINLDDNNTNLSGESDNLSDKKVTPIKSVVNRLAFSNTIYGDEVSQIVFMDDVDISRYRDNRGRPLTEIYLTIIKANRGHGSWYSENNICNDEKVEVSHVFGKITSGLDLPNYITNTGYPTIRRQHNIGIESIEDDKKNVITIPLTSTSLEGDIKISENDIFYGDLVEFNPTTLNETVLENVMHRFNTAQREVTGNPLYSTLYYDEIAGDIYDANTPKDSNPQIKVHKLNPGYANLAPEGYIYKPHHKVKIAQFESNINQGNDMIMDVTIDSIGNVETTTTPQSKTNAMIDSIKPGIDGDEIGNVEITPDLDNKDDNIIGGNTGDNTGDTSDKTENNNNSEKVIKFKTEINYMLLPNDIIGVMTDENDVYKFIVKSYLHDEENKKYTCEATLINTSDKEINDTNKDNFTIFKHNLNIPDYAYMIPDKSGRHLWRDIQKPSEWMFTDELYTTTFTNGAFYHHKNITFPVRRQDPFYNYGMFLSKNEKRIDNNFEITATEYDDSFEEYISENNKSTCF